MRGREKGRTWEVQKENVEQSLSGFSEEAPAKGNQIKMSAVKNVKSSHPLIGEGSGVDERQGTLCLAASLVLGRPPPPRLPGRECPRPAESPAKGWFGGEPSPPEGAPTGPSTLRPLMPTA